MLQDYCNLKLKALASEGHEMHYISQNSFPLFPLRGDRCGEIPVGVDVVKISSGFSMNINEFSQPATSHLCENVCLLNKLNLSFRFRVWRRNSSLFPPNQYFFEGKGATLHSAPYFFEPGNQYFFELDNISPGFFVIGPRSHHYLLNLHNLIETLRMTQELVFCRFDTSSKLTIWNGWKSVNQHQIWVKYNEILSELTQEAWISHQVQQCCNTESLITSCSFCLFFRCDSIY